jgi:[ribosomal protein S18]-alanine N-acetyltransferase
MLHEHQDRASIVVRPGIGADLSAIEHIQAASPESSPWDPPDYLRHFFVMAEQGGACIGFLAWTRLDEQLIEVLNLGVLPAYRGRGAGAKLLQACLASLVQKGDRCLLEVRASNAAARRLYARLGFREIGVRKDYYPPLGPEKSHENAIVLEWKKS